LVAPALLTGGHRNGLPMRQLFIGSLTFEFQDTALGTDGQQAARTQLGGFFDQPIHALVGGNAAPQVHPHTQLSRCVCFFTDAHKHITSAHAQNGGREFAAFAIEQGHQIFWLHSSNLNMSGRAGRQFKLIACVKRRGAMEAG
jgi:hypothetical protein